MQMFNRARNLLRLVKPAEAMSLVQECLALAEKYGMERESGRAHALLAHCQSRLGQFSDSQKHRHAASRLGHQSTWVTQQTASQAAAANRQQRHRHRPGSAPSNRRPPPAPDGDHSTAQWQPPPPSSAGSSVLSSTSSIYPVGHATSLRVYGNRDALGGELPPKLTDYASVPVYTSSFPISCSKVFRTATASR